MAEQHPAERLIEELGRRTVAKRAEAATRSQSSANWTMASLITVNGGAIIALLGRSPTMGWETGVALGAYALGVTSALVAGRMETTLADETETMLIQLSAYENASMALWGVRQSGGSQAQITSASKYLEDCERRYDKARSDFDKTPSPEIPLSLGVVFFAIGCISSGFALF